MPDIRKIFNEIDSNIYQLIKENANKQNESEKVLREYAANKIKLEQTLVLRKMLVGVHQVCSIVSILGPQAAAVDTAVSGVAIAAEYSLSFDSAGKSGKLPIIDTTFKTTVSKVGEGYKETFQLFKKEIAEIDDHINENTRLKTFNDTELNELNKKIKKYVADINVYMDNGAELDPVRNAKLSDKRKELTTAYEEKKKILEGQIKSKEMNVEKKVRIVNKMGTVINSMGSFMDGLDRIKTADTKINENDEKMKQSRQNLAVLKEHQQKISEMLLKVETFQKDIDKMRDDLKG